MIRVSVSEAKNRLSHFLRLVRGGEEVEIMDRDTPVARLVHVSKSSETERPVGWVMDAVRHGLITPPKTKELPAHFLDKDRRLPGGSGVLQALLDEREEGR
jgi:prevent-host-death family protein